MLRVKQLIKRPQGVPGGQGRQILKQSAYEGDNVVSPTYRPPLPPSR